MTENAQISTSKKLTKRQLNFIEALDKSLGIVTQAAKITGTPRETHYLWMREIPLYAEKVNACNELVLDFAESSLYKQVQEGVPASTIFMLKCRGKSRGYVEKSQLEHSGLIGIKPLDIKNATDDELKRIVETATTSIASCTSGIGAEGAG